MALPQVFSREVTDELVARIGKLSPESRALWGKMNVSQMLAHCNVTYEMVYEPERHRKPGGIMKWMLRKMVKPKVVGEQPYKQNNPTAPQFIISDQREFSNEKQRLESYLHKTQELGASWFDGRESHSFGALNATEWNNMFYKHLDHHLKQFGV
ncbi:DUF1569 domain-containing protein [Rurimicrobium arvi]|uniref:DUF1569 domain-containing protein n=1 Tax=Rurimicrobium arvi TaxID=2049916 RepID=A0ABP8N2D5_9BACT